MARGEGIGTGTKVLQQGRIEGLLNVKVAKRVFLGGGGGGGGRGRLLFQSHETCAPYILRGGTAARTQLAVQTKKWLILRGIGTI